MRKQFALLTAAFLLAGCGYSSSDNEMTGQVKKVVHRTPILCFDRYDTDISLGVMRNGVGSMSTQDLWLNVPDPESVKKLKLAADTGKLVKVHYDTYRFTWCTPEETVRSVELLD